MTPTDLLPLWHTYKGLSKYVDFLRQENIRDWAPWCFIPRIAWEAALRDCSQRTNAQIDIPPVDFFAAVGTWRYSQGIYKFDPDVYCSLIKSGFSGNIPCEVLTRLPEWCVYLETPDVKFLDSQIYGCFVYLDDDTETRNQELRITILDEQYDIHNNPLNGILSLSFPLGDWSVEASYAKFIERVSIAINNDNQSIALARFKTCRPAVEEFVKKILALTLYLCSEDPEIIDRNDPGYKPGYPRPKKVKGGWRCFPAQKTRIFDVGQKIGQALRQVQEEMASAPTGRTVADHLRRGHWHGYWIGPREASQRGKRKFIYKWLWPTFVHGRKVADETPNEAVKKSTANTADTSVP